MPKLSNSSNAAVRVNLDAEAITANPVSRKIVGKESEKACGVWGL